jgi:hypothetical protein
VQVGPTGVVRFETREYSMPPAAIGLSATLFLYRDRVRIVAGHHEAVHPRLTAPQAKSLLPEHRAALVAAFSGKRGQRYLKRQHLLALGPVVLAYLTELIHRRPRAWYDDVDRLHDLLGAYGEAALHDAIAQALAAEAFGWEYVAAQVRGHAARDAPEPRP